MRVEDVDERGVDSCGLIMSISGVDLHRGLCYTEAGPGVGPCLAVFRRLKCQPRRLQDINYGWELVNEYAMSLLKKISSALFKGAGEEGGAGVHREYVRCARCGEKICVRVDLANELTPQLDEGEGAYYVRKGVIGSGKNRCFGVIEVELFFSPDRRLVSRYISGGEFITRDEFSGQ